jgi:hypothetical protein
MPTEFIRFPQDRFAIRENNARAVPRRRAGMVLSRGGEDRPAIAVAVGALPKASSLNMASQFLFER